MSARFGSKTAESIGSGSIAGPEWRSSRAPVPYPVAVAQMEERVAAIARGSAPELVWLLEHPPIYTAGTSAKDTDLLDARFPVFKTGRGGQLTYHGPGQRVGYVMLDLRRRRMDVRAFVHDLEAWLIAVLSDFGVTGRRREGYVGIWVERGGRLDKIAAIGVRVRHWITFHGVSLNVDPNLAHYSGIVPCGVRDGGITSLAGLDAHTSIAEVDRVMQRHFAIVFGQTEGRR